jgi:hypothetical protein
VDSREKERRRETGDGGRRELKGGEIRVKKGKDIEMEGQEETWSIRKVGCLKRRKEEEEGEDEKHYGGLEKEGKEWEFKERRSLSENGVMERKGRGMGTKKKSEIRLRLEWDRNGKGDGKERKWERQKNWENRMKEAEFLDVTGQKS